MKNAGGDTSGRTVSGTWMLFRTSAQLGSLDVQDLSTDCESGNSGSEHYLLIWMFKI